jgi:hypothetical protein
MSCGLNSLTNLWSAAKQSIWDLESAAGGIVRADITDFDKV